MILFTLIPLYPYIIVQTKRRPAPSIKYVASASNQQIQPTGCTYVRTLNVQSKHIPIVKRS